MWSVIAVILVLGGLIFFHELGHFFFARLFGVGVKVFSLGFGPKLFGWKRGLTEYRLSALPLGGYVSMVGERPGEDLPPGFSPRHSFTGRPAWQRMIIIAAGPLANFVLAVAIIYGLILAQGVPTPVPLVAEVVAGSPAEAAGLKAGDRIVFRGRAGGHELGLGLRDRDHPRRRRSRAPADHPARRRAPESVHHPAHHPGEERFRRRNSGAAHRHPGLGRARGHGPGLGLPGRGALDLPADGRLSSPAWSR